MKFVYAKTESLEFRQQKIDDIRENIVYDEPEVYFSWQE